MYNKSQLSRDHKAAKEPKKIARPKDKFVIPGAPKVDPNGYWDPANVGRIIEVPLNKDSRSITMSYPDGTPLDQPLIGIGTDTGMMQYMMPGRDYIFPNDSSVIEGPIMEAGGTIMDLTDDEIKMYRDAGYVVDLTPYPERHNPANSFQVTDPRSMQDGGLPKAQNGKQTREKFRKMNLIDLNLDAQQAAKKYMPIDPELFQAYLYYKGAGYKPTSEGCSSGKCYYDENAWKEYSTSKSQTTEQNEEKPNPNKLKVNNKPKPNMVKVNNPSKVNIEIDQPDKNGNVISTQEYYDFPPVSMPTRKVEGIDIDRATPEIIPGGNEQTLIKRYDPEQNKWIINEVNTTDPSVQRYEEQVNWARKNPQNRESSLFISPEEYVKYNDRKKRQSEILNRFLTGMDIGGTYNIGDVVDEDTMLMLKELGYEFE